MTPTVKIRTHTNYISACCAAVLLTWAAPARLQPQTLLLWNAPEGCPQREEILSAVREITGAAVLANTSLHATGSITQVKDRFRLELEVEGERGQYARTLEARICGDLLNATAVVLGLNLKRLAREEVAVQKEDAEPAGLDLAGSASGEAPKGNETKASVPAVPASPAPGTAGDVKPSVASDDSLPTWWVGLPEVHGAIGALPTPTLWWGGTIGKRWGTWMTAISARYHQPQAVRSAELSDVSAEVTRYGVGLAVARGWRTERFELAPAAVVGLERLVVRGIGESVVSAEASGTVLLIGARLTGRWFLTRWLGIAVSIGADIPASRPRFVVQSLGTPGQIGPVIGEFSPAVEWNF